MVRIVLALLVGAALGISGTLVYPRVIGMASRETPPRTVPTEGSTNLAPRVVLALGTIEPRQGVIQVASAVVGSRIREIPVAEGQIVKAGDTLVVLDDEAAQEELQLAEALQREGESRLASEKDLAAERVSVAELAVRQLAEGKSLQLESQRAQLQLVMAKRKQAEKDVERLEELRQLPTPLATPQQVDYQRVALEAAQAEFVAAQTALEQLEQSLRFSQEKAETELRAARTALRQFERDDSIQVLQQRTNLAKWKLEQLVIKAPSNGTILAIQSRAGEIVAQQPLLQLADLSDLVCVAEVDAGVIHDLSTDKDAPTPARIRGRALGDVTLSGTVERVGNSASQPSLRFADPRQPVDRTVAKVLVGIRGPNTSLPADLAILIGLQVEVEFTLDAMPSVP